MLMPGAGSQADGTHRNTESNNGTNIVVGARLMPGAAAGYYRDGGAGDTVRYCRLGAPKKHAKAARASDADLTWGGVGRRRRQGSSNLMSHRVERVLVRRVLYFGMHLP